MNEYDSLIAKKVLGDASFLPATSPDEADVILLNTCSVRENAHTKIYNRLQSLKHLYKRGVRVGILGCMAQSLGEELLHQDLPVNFVLGPDALRELGEKAASGESGAQVKLSRSETYDDIIPPIDLHTGMDRVSLSANVAIQRGCDNFCTFCIVPHTRGRERSRPPESIIREIEALSGAGIQSVVLLGQNVNSYHHEKTSFPELVRRILEATDIKRLSYTSPHPKDFPEELIEMTANQNRLGSRIHIPLQSGDDEVLARMRREYTRGEFTALVRNFRARVPGVTITTDVIVGFPGETEKQYRRTLDTMEECRFDDAFMFAYSERKGTSAALHYPDDVPEEVKKERLENMIAIQNKRCYEINQEDIGREISILVDGVSRRNARELSGTGRNGKRAVAPMADNATIENYLGKEVRVQVTSATAKTLLGVLPD